MPNRYRKHIEEKHAKSEAERLVRVRLMSELLPLSTDYHGTPTSFLFDSSDVKRLKEFLEVMKEHRYVGAENISLKTRRSSRVLSSLDQLSEPISLSKRAATRPLWRKLWAGKGYLLGAYYSGGLLHPKYSDCSEVYLCSDGKLRCRRSYPVFPVGSSLANGYGTIPAKFKALSDLRFASGRFASDAQTDFRSFVFIGLGEILTDLIDRKVA